MSPPPELALDLLELHGEQKYRYMQIMNESAPSVDELLVLTNEIQQLSKNSKLNINQIEQNISSLDAWIPDAEVAVAKATSSDGQSRLSVMANGSIRIIAPVPTPPSYPVKRLPTPVVIEKKKKIETELEPAAPGDYSRTKPPPSQTPITQFWTFCEQYLRPLTPADLEALIRPQDDLTPFSYPALGTHYKQLWHDDDARQYALYEDGVSCPALGMGKEYLELEDTVFEGDVSIGRLTQRFLSCFAREGVVPDLKVDLEHQKSGTGRSKEDLDFSEQRLEKELIHLGLLESRDSMAENDEISRQLLDQQQELSSLLKTNQSRKTKLLGTASKFMGYQEYNTLLDEINKNISDQYVKRHVTFTKLETKSKKSKKEGQGIKACI